MKQLSVTVNTWLGAVYKLIWVMLTQAEPSYFLPAKTLLASAHKITLLLIVRLCMSCHVMCSTHRSVSTLTMCVAFYTYMIHRLQFEPACTHNFLFRCVWLMTLTVSAQCILCSKCYFLPIQFNLCSKRLILLVQWREGQLGICPAAIYFLKLSPMTRSQPEIESCSATFSHFFSWLFFISSVWVQLTICRQWHFHAVNRKIIC